MMAGPRARLRDRLACVGAVIWDGLTGHWTRSSKYSGPPAPSVFPPEDWRAEVMSDFALWLRSIPATPGSTPHADMDLVPDRFDVLLELSALRQEIKRQSRAQGKLSEELVQMGELYQEALNRVNTRGEDLAALRLDVQRETEKSVFLLFADMRDALERGIEEIQRSSVPRGFFKRTYPDWEAVKEGYEIALDRFDRSMSRLGIQKILTVGREFDPRLMVAIATRQDTGHPAGTVVEEMVSGYTRSAEVLRTAQVVVAS